MADARSGIEALKTSPLPEIPPAEISCFSDHARLARTRACTAGGRRADVALTDLAATGETYVSRADADPIHQRSMIAALAKNYLGEGGDPRDPLASPLYAEPHRACRRC